MGFCGPCETCTLLALPIFCPQIIDGPGVASRRWRLAFDTMGLRSADADTLRLRAHLQVTGKAG